MTHDGGARDELLGIQSHLLEQLARGANTQESLDHLCLAIERLVPNTICSIMYLEPETGSLSVGSAPNAPASLCAKLKGLVPSESAASCGTAAYTGEPVIVEDTHTDPRWADYRDLAREFGIRACWSIPVFCDGAVVGTFAISSTESRLPTALELQALETGGHLTGIAIHRMRAEQERRIVDTKIQQSQKMESLGVLAGGIAHDFNNLLTGALGNVDLANASLPAESGARAHLERVESAVLQMAELSRQMLAYSGRAPIDKQPICLATLISETVNLLETSVSKNITIQMQLPAKGPTVLGDVARLRQVVMNLITNASDAIGDQPGTVMVNLSSGPRTKDDLVALQFGSKLSAGDYASLEVLDNGCGMSSETQQRMFDPFYTTKQRGHGLGLAATLGIIKSHDGAVQVESKEQVGTRVRVLLPTVSSDTDTPQARLQESDPLTTTPTQTVLVVDDEECIRSLTTTILEKAGFQVLTSSDGLEAIETFKSHSGHIDVILLDYTMPGIDGDEVCKRLRAIRDVPVVLSSGFSESEATGQLEDLDVAGYLQKPYRASALTEILQRAVSSKRTTQH